MKYGQNRLSGEEVTGRGIDGDVLNSENGGRGGKTTEWSQWGGG